MPFKSTAQRAFMYAKHPAIAARWQKMTPKGAKLPTHVKKTKAKVVKPYKQVRKGIATNKKRAMEIVAATRGH